MKRRCGLRWCPLVLIGLLFWLAELRSRYVPKVMFAIWQEATKVERLKSPQRWALRALVLAGVSGIAGLIWNKR